jgi:hypothetical protein
MKTSCYWTYTTLHGVTLRKDNTLHSYTINHSLKIWDQISHPSWTTGKIKVSYNLIFQWRQMMGVWWRIRFKLEYRNNCGNFVSMVTGRESWGLSRAVRYNCNVEGYNDDMLLTGLKRSLHGSSCGSSILLTHLRGFVLLDLT